MAKKFLAVIMAAILLIPCATFAKKKLYKLPQSEWISVAVVVTDATNFNELNTAEILADMIITRLHEKKLFNIVGVGNGNLAKIKTLETSGAADVGDMVTFPTKNLEFDKDLYRNMGAQYVINCEILGLGFNTEEENDFGFGGGIGVGIGTGGAIGIGVSDGAALRKLYCTAVNMQIIKVESGKVMERQNLVGRALKHRKPREGYDNAIDEAYLKSLDNAAKNIVKRVETFSEKVY